MEKLGLALATVGIVANMAIMAIFAMAWAINNMVTLGIQLKSTKKLAQWC